MLDPHCLFDTFFWVLHLIDAFRSYGGEPPFDWLRLFARNGLENAEHSFQSGEIHFLNATGRLHGKGGYNL